MADSLIDSLDTHDGTEPCPLGISYKDIGRNFHAADRQYEIIMECIKEFENGLDTDHEVAIKLASFGQSITLSVTDVGYSNPDILVFHGYVEGHFATLVQHVSQLNFLLLSVQKRDPEKPPRRIGFLAPIDD